MNDREFVVAVPIAPGLNVSLSTALRIVKKGKLKVYKYRDNSVSCRQSDIEAYKRQKRGD